MDDKATPPEHPAHDSRLEFRYLIIKVADLSDSQRAKIEKVITNRKIPLTEGVVCERDWPMYEEVVSLVVPGLDK